MEDEQTNRTKSASEDSFYIKELKQGNIKAFEFLFNKYYKDLVYFCNVFLKDQENSEDLYRISLHAYGKIENISILKVL